MYKFTRVQLSAILLVASVQAFAEEPQAIHGVTAGGEVSTTSPSDVPGSSSLLNKVYVNYFAIFHGPSFKDPASVYTVDRTGKASTSNAINLDSELTTAYMFTPSFGVGPVIPFLLVPVMGQGVILGDAGIKAFDKKAVSYSGLDIYANAIVQAPTSKSSQARNMTFALKTTPNVRYSFPASRFTLGAWTEAKAYLGVTEGKTFKLYGAPYVNYRVLRNLSLNFEFEAEAQHKLGDAYMNFTMYQTDVQPGIVWNITPRILVNPYFQIFTTNQASADSTALGAVVSATLL